MIHRAYWPNDDAHALDGDADFQGVLATGRPELLKPGYLADARNMRRDVLGGYVVRPAARALRWAAPSGAPMLDQRIVRAVRYVHPTTRASKVLLVLSSRLVYTVSPGEGVYSYGPLPGTGTLRRVEFAQLPNGLVAFVTTDAGVETYVFDHHTLTWSAPPAPQVPGNERLPPSGHGVYWQSRLFVLDGRKSPERRNTIWVGDFGYGRDAYEGSSTYQSFRLFGSGDDEVVALLPFSDQRLLVFRRNSIFVLTGVRGTNEQIVQAANADLITGAWGAVGPDGMVLYGGHVFVLSGTRRALMLLRVTDTGWVQADEAPLSDRVTAWFEDINWAAADQAMMMVHDQRLYLAVPTGTARTNNRVYVYNLLTQEWESRDDLPVAGYFTYDTAIQPGQLGMVMYLPEGSEFYSGGAGWLAGWVDHDQDEYPLGEAPWWQTRGIPASLTTRAFFLPDRMESRVVSVSWVEESVDARYRTRLLSGNDADERVWDVREISPNGWEYPWDRPARKADNSDDDARDAGRVDWGEYPTGFKLGGGFLLAARKRQQHWNRRSRPAVSHQLSLTVERGLLRFFGLRFWMRRAALRSTAVSMEPT